MINNNSRSRSRTEIVSQILDTAAASRSGGRDDSDSGGGVTKIRLMYKAFLNHEQLKAYLALLTKNDLLYYDKTRRTFKTTEKGLRFLEAYNQLDQILKEQHC